MNSRALVVITTRLAPQVCGIGTYSWLLHQNWGAGHGDVEFVVVDGADASRTALNFPKISPFNSSPDMLAGTLHRAGAADVLLHYAGRAYHRYGFPRWLPPVIDKWKRDFPGGRLLIFFHEMPGNFPVTSRYFWIDKLNRSVIARLARSADAIATNTLEHAAQLTRLSKRHDINVVPVPPNIQPSSNSIPKPTHGEFALLGLPFGRWQTLRCFKRELHAWQEAGRLTRLHLIGPHDEKFASRSRDILRALPDPSIVIEHGMLPPEKVSALLLRAQFGLSNAIEATWSKSSVFMTYAAHGCNVIVAEKSEMEPLSLGVAAQEVGEISDVDLASRSMALRQWYQSHATWPVISAQISLLLPLETPVQAKPANEIVILTPEAPGAGGVGDYTQRVAEALPNPAETRTEVWPVDRERLAQARKLLLQYSAYGFDRHGYPRQLIRELLNWKKETGGKLVIMFHEIWTFWPKANKNALLQFFHRRGIGALVRVADAVFTTTSGQADHLRALAPERPVGVIPVGSNIRVRNDVDLTRHHDWAVVFGLGGSRIRALREMHDSITALARAGRINRVVTIGGSEKKQAEEEQHLLASIPLRDGFEQLGRRSDGEVSEQLLRAGFAISERDELSLSKSGTFMAYAAHGLNVISPVSDPRRPEPVCLLVSTDELLNGLPDRELKERANRLRAWQSSVSSWPLIASTFADALHLER